MISESTVDINYILNDNDDCYYLELFSITLRNKNKKVFEVLLYIIADLIIGFESFEDISLSKDNFLKNLFDW